MTRTGERTIAGPGSSYGTIFGMTDEPMTPVRALIIDPNQAGFRIEWIEPEGEVIAAIVGGYLEMVALTSDSHLYCNEDGKQEGEELSALATVAVDRFKPGFAIYDVLVGTTVWLGRDGRDGEEKDCPLSTIYRVARTHWHMLGYSVDVAQQRSKQLVFELKARQSTDRETIVVSEVVD